MAIINKTLVKHICSAAFCYKKIIFTILKKMLILLAHAKLTVMITLCFIDVGRSVSVLNCGEYGS